MCRQPNRAVANGERVHLSDAAKDYEFLNEMPLKSEGALCHSFKFKMKPLCTCIYVIISFSLLPESGIMLCIPETLRID